MTSKMEPTSVQNGRQIYGKTDVAIFASQNQKNGTLEPLQGRFCIILGIILDVRLFFTLFSKNILIFG